MQKTQLGPLSHVSRLALGGGGIGQVWGETTREEALTVVAASLAAGINLFDMAPMYGNGEAESVLGEYFAGHYPDDVAVTTKCMLGNQPADRVYEILARSLDESFARLQRDFVDVFILHGFVVEDDWQSPLPKSRRDLVAVPWRLYLDAVLPSFAKLQSEGKIGTWGITAASTPAANLLCMNHDTAPGVIQAVTNLLDSSGSMAMSAETPNHREVMAIAKSRGVGVMGIRAAGAGALTDAFDREVSEKLAEHRDYQRAAVFRDLAKQEGMASAQLAHAYALQMANVDSVVLGVKNLTELAECVAAEATPVSADLIDRINNAINQS